MENSRNGICIEITILFHPGMVRRSEGIVQRNLGFQHVPGTAFPVPVPVHDIAVHVVHRAVLLSHGFRHGPGTERNRRVHHHKHNRSYEHRWNGTFTHTHFTHRAIIISINPR